MYRRAGEKECLSAFKHSHSSSRVHAHRTSGGDWADRGSDLLAIAGGGKGQIRGKFRRVLIQPAADGDRLDDVHVGKQGPAARICLADAGDTGTCMAAIMAGYSGYVQSSRWRAALSRRG